MDGLVRVLWNHPQVSFIEAQVDPANVASVGVLVRAGFGRVGVVDEHDSYRLDAAARG